MRKLSHETLIEVERLKSSGYSKSSKSLRNYIRSYNCPNVKIFKVGSCVSAGKGSKKYTCNDIFGYHQFSHIYDKRYTDKFVNYLVSIFLSRNPEPDVSIRKAFTRIMHNNGLHWKYCFHSNKKIEEDNLDRRR